MSRKKPEQPALRLFSLARPAPGLDALGFLRRLAHQERFFWQPALGRQGEIGAPGAQRFAGAGIAAELTAWGERRFLEIEHAAARLFANACTQTLQPQTPEAPAEAGPRLFGGFAFRDDFVPDYAWSDFYPAHFILPHFQLCEVDGQAWLTINALLPSDEDPAVVFDPQTGALAQALDLRYAWLLQAETQPQDPPAAPVEAGLSVRYPMDFPAWEALIEQAVRTIGAQGTAVVSGALHKVVLARMCEVSSAGPLELEAALGELCAAYPDCYTYFFAPRPGCAFLGATPELLVSVQGAALRSMALAGSIRRGRTPAEDDTLAAALFNSAKDRYEHDLVAVELRRRLSLVSAELLAPAEPQVLRFRNIQHLHTPFSARLKKPKGVLTVLARLHPTPALGGMPRPAALEFIRQYEPLTRGWYAAPVGWLDSHLDGCFAVGIRSAVVQRERAWLYAGAGIVAASQAQSEWEETALKFRPMLQALVR